jgi:rsbT antagonist protein RsbS
MKDVPIDTVTPMSIVRNCLVVTLQGELYDDALIKIRADVLEKIQAAKVRGMILDLCTVPVLDSFSFNRLADTARMASLLGAVSVFVGLQPGVVSSLVDLEVEIGDVRTALTMEDGFEQIQDLLSIHGQPQDAEEPDNMIIENDEEESDGEEGWAPANETSGKKNTAV